jgi:hypothetical protein
MDLSIPQRLWYRFMTNDNHVHDCRLGVSQPITEGIVVTLRVLPEGLSTASAAIEALTARLAAALPAGL